MRVDIHDVARLRLTVDILDFPRIEPEMPRENPRTSLPLQYDPSRWRLLHDIGYLSLFAASYVKSRQIFLGMRADEEREEAEGRRRNVGFF
jgi:hypothetical protein